MEKKQQTAVEWLWKWIMDNPFGSFEDGAKAYNQAKQMEKDQIIAAFEKGADDGYYGESSFNKEKYYNETYGKETDSR